MRMFKRKSRIILIWFLVTICFLILIYKYQFNGSGSVLPFDGLQSSGTIFKLISVQEAAVIKVNVNEHDRNLSSSRRESKEELYQKCSHYTCFNVSRCETINRHISIYIYPIANYVDSTGVTINKLSEEFKLILSTIASSPFFTSNPREACLFIPSVDLTGFTHHDQLPSVLESLPFWSLNNVQKGSNHLLFNFNQKTDPNSDVHRHSAIVAGTSFDSWTFRPNYDVSIPNYHSIQKSYHKNGTINGAKKWTLLIVTLESFTSSEQLILSQLEEENPHFFKSIDSTDITPDNDADNEVVNEPINEKKVNYIIKSMEQSRFCLINSNQFLTLSLMTNCVPIVPMSDNYVRPFEEKVKWNLLLINLRKDNLINVINIINSIVKSDYNSMVKYGKYVYDKYMSSLSKIVLSTIEIINDRLIPFSIADLDDEIESITCNRFNFNSGDNLVNSRRKKKKRKDVFS